MRLSHARLIEALPPWAAITVAELARRLFGPSPTRTQLESVRRSARSLADRKLVVLGYRVEGGRRHLIVRARDQQPERRERREQPKCLHCGRRFATWRREKARYCSDACRQGAYRYRRRQRLKARGIELPPRDRQGRFAHVEQSDRPAPWYLSEPW